MLKKWGINVLIGIDQFFNAFFGGDPDETISSRIGKIKQAHGGRIKWHRPLTKIIDWFLDKIDTNHSIDAIELDEGKDALFDKFK